MRGAPVFIKKVLWMGILLQSLPLLAQVSIPNPLIKPAKSAFSGGAAGGSAGAAQQSASSAPSKAAGADASGSAEAGAPAAGRGSESISAKQQALNAERIPAPLRVHLSNLVVTAVVGDLAVLRQPVLVSSTPNLAAANAALGQAQAPGLGGASGVPPSPSLSPNAGLQGASAPNTRPISYRLRNGAPLDMQGYFLRPVILDAAVSLYWRPSDSEPETLVYYGVVESLPTPAFVPLRASLEASDPSYVQKLTPTVSQSVSSPGASALPGGSGGGQPGLGGVGGGNASPIGVR